MGKPNIILGIETTCDETAAAIVQKSDNRVKILSNVVASSALLQAKYGGVIPEQAAREQLKSIIPVIEEALKEAKVTPLEIDVIAVSFGPGLIGSLLVGVETAKSLSLTWNKPLIPVNHLIGHFYANWIGQSDDRRLTTDDYPQFPCIGLLVSGGHTDLVLFQDHNKYENLGGTRDDAAGECFDKCARLLNLPYPGGPAIAQLAKSGNPQSFNLPRPMINSKDLDFSFSGLKTAVANLLPSVIPRVARNLPPSSTIQAGKILHFVQDDKNLANLAASIEQAIVDVLVEKTIKAAQTHHIEHIIIAGGVAANEKLVKELNLKTQGLDINLHVPPAAFCTDNAAMIATAAFFQKPIKDPLTLQADPNLALTH